jgi:hypothetical protein
VADGVTGRRRRQKPGTVLEVMCDAHPAPQMLIRPALDERGLTLTGDQGATVARATNQGTEPGAGALKIESVHAVQAKAGYEETVSVQPEVMSARHGMAER